MAQALAKLLVPLQVVMDRLELVPPALAALTPTATAADGLQALLANGLSQEGIHLLAHALPRREAVWWACMCADATVPAALAPEDRAARDAAEAWVRNAGEEALRRAAGEAAQRTGFQSPEAWVAMAAFWSGGSMAPEGVPTVAPGEAFTGRAVAGSVLLAAVRLRPADAAARLLRFIESARDIASGGAGRLSPEET